MVTETNKDEEDKVIWLCKQILEEFSHLNLEATGAAPADDSAAVVRPLLPDIDTFCGLYWSDLSTD